MTVMLALRCAEKRPIRFEINRLLACLGINQIKHHIQPPRSQHGKKEDKGKKGKREEGKSIRFYHPLCLSSAWPNPLLHPHHRSGTVSPTG